MRQLFNNFIAYLSTIFVLISPVWLNFARQARFYFFTSFFSLFYFYLLITGFKKGNTRFIYLSLLCLSLTINFHYVSILLLLPLFAFFFLRRSVLKLNKIKAFLSFLVFQIPFVIVNIKEDFVPLVKTVIWIPYRILGFVGIIEKNNLSVDRLERNLISLAQMFAWNFKEGTDLFAISIGTVFLIYSLYCLKRFIKSKKIDATSVFSLSLWLFYLGLFIHGDPPYHYYAPVLTIFPIIIALAFEKLKIKYKISEKLVYLFLVFFLLVANFRYFFSNYWFRNKYEFENGSVSFALQKLVSQKIIEDAGGSEFSLKRIGEFDYYQGYYAQNYQYFLWWLGNEPREKAEILYTIYEGEDRLEDSREEIIFRNYGLIVTKRVKNQKT